MNPVTLSEAKELFAVPALTPKQLETLVGIGNGCDVWGYTDAEAARALEKVGLVKVVKAKFAPRDGAKRQPYFGAKRTAAGTRAVSWFVRALQPKAATL